MSQNENQRILQQLSSQVQSLVAQFNESSSTQRGTPPYPTATTSGMRRNIRSSAVGRPRTARNGGGTSMERQQAFLGNPRRLPIDFEDDDYDTELFKKVITVIARKFEDHLRLRPSTLELMDLNDAGLGEIEVELSEKDSPTAVRHKIELACPLLKQVGGWFAVLKSILTNSGKMEIASPTKIPIPSGRELKNMKAVLFIAPLRKNLTFPKRMSGEFVKCEECLMNVDTSDLLEHISVCTPQSGFEIVHDSSEQAMHSSFSRPSTSAGNHLNEVAAIGEALSALQAFKSTALDFETSEENIIEVTRPGYLEAATSAAATQNFLNKIKEPLKVHYLDEIGIDVGGLRRDFLTRLVNAFEIKLVRRINLSDEFHFTAGVFTAIAILQENLTRKYVITQLTNDHFLRGLNTLGLGDFLVNNPSVNILFRDDPVTGDCFIAMLRTNTNEDATADYIQRITFQLFTRFVNEVNNGEVLRASSRQRMEVSDILMFATGSKHICASMEKTINVRYVFPQANSYPRPRASTCNEEITLAVTIDYDVFKTSWVEAIASMEAGFHQV